MSILLDALRKSEEQRRRGQAPEMNDPEAGRAVQASRPRRWVWGSLITLLVLAAAWVGWQRLVTTEAVPGSAAESATVTGDRAKSDAGVQTGPTREPTDSSPADGSHQSRRMSTDVPAADKGAAAAVADPPGRQITPSKSHVNQSFTEFQAPREQAAETAPPAASGDQPQAVALVHESSSVAGQTQPSEAARAARSDVPPQGRASAPRATEPISFWELPQKIRDSLPDLRITVLVYAERPENRFLLMGGRRVVEKDELQDGVVLDEIRRDGAVFSYRNYRFLVKG